MRFLHLAISVLAALAPVLGQTPAPKPDAAVALTNGVTVRGKYLTLLVGLSQDTVAPGGTVTLMVRATPGPKIHVYAPGQQGYIPVAVTLDKNTAFRTRPLVYPPSTMFEFVPLSEKVKVYDAPFTLRQDLVLVTTADLKRRAAAGDTLIVKGTFAYQACDDTICYRPETLAVEWKIRLQP